MMRKQRKSPQNVFGLAQLKHLKVLKTKETSAWDWGGRTKMLSVPLLRTFPVCRFRGSPRISF